MTEYRRTETVELKSSFDGNAVTREIVAFLNSRGGTVWIGVSDDGVVTGVEDADRILRHVGDIVTYGIEPSPAGLVKCTVSEEEGGSVVGIAVSKGPHSLYCIKRYGFSMAGCPVRIGTSCMGLPHEEINLRYRKQFETSGDFMLQIPAGYGDISFGTMQIELLNRGYHVNTASFEENYRLRNGEGRYNLLAELMSDNNNTHLIFVKFRGRDRSSVSERTNYGRTSLITSFRQIRDRLAAENVCMSDTSVRPRRDVYLYDVEAVNEALINALVHNDWNIAEPLVSMFDDRLEIVSHGGLPFSQTRENFFRGISVPRNRELMRIFQDLEITESTGHGILKIIQSYGKDVFEIGDSFVKVTIPFDREVMENHRAADEAVFRAARATNASPTRTELDIIGELIADPGITFDRLADRLKIGRRTVARKMSRLQKAGYVEREGSRGSGFWRVLK